MKTINKDYKRGYKDGFKSAINALLVIMRLEEFGFNPYKTLLDILNKTKYVYKEKEEDGDGK